MTRPAGKLLLKVTLHGQPKGKGRPRFNRAQGSKPRTPTGTKSWESSAAVMMRAPWVGPPLNEPVKLIVRAVSTRPRDLHRKKDSPGRIFRPKKPDLDNVVKIVADALTKAGVWVDDARMVILCAVSLYTAIGESSCVEVEVWTPNAAEAATPGLIGFAYSPTELPNEC